MIQIGIDVLSDASLLSGSHDRAFQEGASLDGTRADVPLR